MRLSQAKREELVGLVVEQILEDAKNQDVDGIFALLLSTPKESLLGFLPETTNEYFLSNAKKV